MGRYLDIIRQVEAIQKPMDGPSAQAGRSSGIKKTPKEIPPALVPGSLITWLGSDDKPRGPGTVDFIHTDTEGAVCAFVSLPDGTWVALNVKYLRVR